MKAVFIILAILAYIAFIFAACRLAGANELWRDEE